MQNLSSLTPIVDNIFDKYNKNLVPIRSLSDHDICVVPTRMEEAPKAALDIHCLRQGGGVALTQMINLIPPPRGDGGAWALTASAGEAKIRQEIPLPFKVNAGPRGGLLPSQLQPETGAD